MVQKIIQLQGAKYQNFYRGKDENRGPEGPRLWWFVIQGQAACPSLGKPPRIQSRW
jgi:hypothetical protein